jgi:tetratricopeptide (TPR) repeat protein
MRRLRLLRGGQYAAPGTSHACPLAFTGRVQSKSTGEKDMPRSMRLCSYAVATGLALAACEAPAPRTTAAPPAPALFESFGALHRDTGSRVPAAQRYFDQGLRMAYGFNHEAAGRAFAEAARLDPDCAICVWGQALVLGPNINLPMQAGAVQDATTLARRAQALSSHARPVDRALIAALSQRYADPAPPDRTSLDRAYADAMASAAHDYPDDDDVATLHAEALMDLSPWAYWTRDGKPTEFTPQILATLERVLRRNPQHIGAMHYYIHATEASPTPQRAEPYADRLAALAPGSGHLVHMPAHTYIRIGRYHDATLTNLAAGTADKAFLAVCHGSNGIYPLGYVPHNWHFATMTAGLSGSRTLALEAAAQAAQRVDRDMMATPPLEAMQLFLVAPLFTQVRFGEWDAILAQAEAPAALPFPTAIWHFARGMAQARKGALAGAQDELDALRGIAVDPALAKVSFLDINHADGLVAVAVPLLRGELLRAHGRHDAGIAALREAAAAEDALNYDEPADWPLPVRPYLGAALLEAGHAREAADVYRQDLRTYPDNGWSLLGLAQAQRTLGDTAAAIDSERRFAAAWQWADVTPRASRM